MKPRTLSLDEQNQLEDAESIIRAGEVLRPLLEEEREVALTRLSHKFQNGESDYQTEVATIVAMNNVLKKVERLKRTYEQLKEKQHV